MKKLMLVVSIALFTLATVGSMTAQGDMALNEALAEGRCCEDVGTCFPTGCATSDCSKPGEYWRDDGKDCDGKVIKTSMATEMVP